MNRQDVIENCKCIVYAGYGEYAISLIASDLKDSRIKLELENGEMRNSLEAIHKINRGRDEAISALSELGDKIYERAR